MGAIKGRHRQLILSSFTSIILQSFSAAIAGGIEHLIFDSEGHKIDVRAGEVVPENARIVKSKVLSTCVEAPGRTCIKWQLVPASGQNASQLLTSIAAALNLFSNNQDLSVSWVYNGISSQPGIPPASLDDRANLAVSGNFLVSFVPPPPSEMPFPPGVVSTSIKYVYVDLETNEGDIRWGGIYLNPAYQPGVHYRLDTVIANEAGRILGLAPSASRNAVMFPLQPAQSQSVLRLASDDLMYLHELYPAEGVQEEKGSLSGEVIDGNTGNKIPGVSVELIPLNKRDEFAQDPAMSRRLAGGGAFSRAEGIFRIPNVSPGEYLILFESLVNIPAARSLWDDWIMAFGSTELFTTEFYDGGGRESNQEALSGFSSQMIYLAAIVKVDAGQETTGVQLITNASILNPPSLIASGSSNERLTEIDSTITDRLRQLQSAANNEPPPSEGKGSGGCNLKAERASDPWSEWGLFVALILFLLWRGDLRKEAYRFVFQTIEKFRR